mgnify:CR=1 FL=1
MLSGNVPFQVCKAEDQASAIMHEIKIGRFSFKGSAWDSVSDSAKLLIQGTQLIVLVKFSWLK